MTAGMHGMPAQNGTFQPPPNNEARHKFTRNASMKSLWERVPLQRVLLRSSSSPTACCSLQGGMPARYKEETEGQVAGGASRIKKGLQRDPKQGPRPPANVTKLQQQRAPALAACPGQHSRWLQLLAGSSRCLPACLPQAKLQTVLTQPGHHKAQGAAGGSTCASITLLWPTPILGHLVCIQGTRARGKKSRDTQRVRKCKARGGPGCSQERHCSLRLQHIRYGFSVAQNPGTYRSYHNPPQRRMLPANGVLPVLLAAALSTACTAQGSDCLQPCT